MYNHDDLLKGLDSCLPIEKKVEKIHQALKQSCSFIARISVATYDAKTDMLRTFVASTEGGNPLVYYDRRLSEVPSLSEILRQGRPRVVNDMQIYAQSNNEHTCKIRSQGFRASYTMPMYLNGVFWGFVFFNSYEKDCLTESVLPILDIYGHLVSSIIVNEAVAIKNMLAALKTANEMVHVRDPETGGHLDRMSRYARLIAQELAVSGRYRFTDEFIERIYQFAPLHDIGKIGIPDRVLLKPTRLDAKEFEVMKTHTTKGLQLIKGMIENFGLESLDSVKVLCNVTKYHHEAMDGSGYPSGLKGEEIPIEARIVAVADVFDALASVRPYKEAWSNERAFAMLEYMAFDKLDSDCVQALIKNREKVEQLQAQFLDQFVRLPSEKTRFYQAAGH